MASICIWLSLHQESSSINKHSNSIHCQILKQCHQQITIWHNLHHVNTLTYIINSTAKSLIHRLDNMGDIAHPYFSHVLTCLEIALNSLLFITSCYFCWRMSLWIEPYAFLSQWRQKCWQFASCHRLRCLMVSCATTLTKTIVSFK